MEEPVEHPWMRLWKRGNPGDVTWLMQSMFWRRVRLRQSRMRGTAIVSVESDDSGDERDTGEGTGAGHRARQWGGKAVEGVMGDHCVPDRLDCKTPWIFFKIQVL